MSSSSLQDTARLVEQQASIFQGVRDEIAKVIVGQRYMVDRLLLGLLADGHILLEGIPGLAKTTAVKAVADCIHTGFARIQFTPDLLPADLLGTEIYRPQSGEFTVKRGPIFSNLVLADEINRAPAKVQSALLEAMQERQVTIGEQTFALPKPFLVLATQNPIEQEGTYALPEAQVDRFMLKLKVGYPSREEEREIMRRMSRRSRPEVKPIIDVAAINQAQEAIAAIHLDPKIEDYIVEVVFATREPAGFGLSQLAGMIAFGASPRATIALAQASRVHAFLAGRHYVTPQDVKTIGPDVLRHRVLLTYEAEARELQTDDVIRDIFNRIDVP
ncbi:MAG: MoxR family ATPase [Myxococcota bacterium]